MSKLHPACTSLCSTLAIATALMVGASPAAAQALLGKVTSSTGVGTITNGTGTTVIPVTSPQAVIDWTATGPSSGGVTTFSNAGSSTSFTGQTNFAILNRVTPGFTGDAILMGGNINSLVNGQVGGTVYFYSPNGIVIGGNATINVGSLGLTTLPISDTRGVWMSGFGTSTPQISFGAATNAASFVRTQASGGGAINANGAGNYIALVAPRVEHRGVIRTDSGAALVAAGAATITFNPSGFYNIVIPTGSSDANGVVVDGGRIERNSAAVGGPHRAYLVSVPANNAMTMLVQGGAQLGFDIAGSAAIEGNAVVLAAGRGVVAGSVRGAAGGPASATIDHATIGSNLVVDATTTARISSGAGATSLAGAVTLSAPGISVIAENHRLSIAGSLTARADQFGGDGIGGAVTVAARNGQTLAVGGDVAISANGDGVEAAREGLSAGNGTGGTIDLRASGGGALTIGGALIARANGLGGFTGYSNGAGGTGTGGTINIDASGGASTVSVGGFTTVEASGIGGTTLECTSCAIGGGNGLGGTINVTGGVRAATSGANRLDFTRGQSLVADGTGGAGDATAGAGRGGAVRLVTSDGTIVNSRFGFVMAAGGFGGAYLGSGAGNGGDGTGGDVQIGAYDSAGGAFNLDGPQGPTIFSAEGVGGNVISGTGTGGIGQGGRIAIDAKGAAIALGGDVFMDAIGEGGSAFGGTGGRAAGGSLFTHAFGSHLTISGNLTLLATAFGGNGLIGGLSQGGTVSAGANAGSRLSVSGRASLDASGLGGSGGSQSGNRGGRAQGGDVSLFAATGGSLAVGSVFLTAFAFGGGGYEGGHALAGHGTVFTNAGTIDLSGEVFAFVSATGGTGDGANGGAATGGRFELVADGGTIDIDGPVTLSTGAFGGGTFGKLATGGAATGGGLQVHARNGGTLTLTSALFGSSEGHGGNATAVSARAGDGQGGSVDLAAIGVNSTLDARGFVTLLADGVGGIAVCGECSTGAAGGNGTGGQVFAQTHGGDGNRILIGNNLSLSASGRGSAGYGGAGGIGQGGTAGVFLTNNARIAVGGGLAISARGDGGYQSNGGQAGAGTGGDAQISLAGGATSLLTVGTNQGSEVDRSTTLDTSGYGGSTGRAAGGIGGAGTGGWSRIYGTGGSANFMGNVVIEAEGDGGNGESGAGGPGTGGRARLNADGAAYRLGGTVAIVTDATGGTGRDGGSASLRAIENETNNSGMFANHGGSIVVNGAATLSANAVGGNGMNGGNGGSASAGRASVVVNGSVTGNGGINLAGVTVIANATGGNGAAASASLPGGNGGNATGGLAELSINNSASGTNRLTAGGAYLGALAHGGNGGRGGSGGDGARGGSGGVGTGGSSVALTGAGNGAFIVSDLSIYASGFGGRGGDGGSGTGKGGTGGAGGTGDGGNVIAGIASGAATPTTASMFTAATLLGFANSQGGDGGNGGTGALGSGNGGNGGDALLSFNQLLARGGAVTIGSARLTVDARGGNGGVGAVSGNGGTAFTPDVLVTATNRLNQPAAGATLIVDALDFHANAYAGTGAIAGRAIAQGGPQLLVQNSTARFGSFSMVSIAGDAIAPASVADPIRILNGTVSVATGFRFATDHRLSVLVDNGSLTAGTVTLNAASFERDTTAAPPAARGTISAGTFGLTSGGAMIIDANLRSGANLLINVPGEVIIGNIAAATEIGIRAGSTIKLGAIESGLSTNLVAAGAIDVGNVTSNGAVNLLSSGGAVTVGNVGARGAIGLDAGGSLVAGNMSGGDAVRLLSKGTTQVGSVVAGGSIQNDSGGNLRTGALIGGSILLKSGGLLTTANLTSTQSGIAVTAVGTVALADVASASTFLAKTSANLTLGNLRSNGDATIDGGGNITTGTIDAGSVDFVAVRNIAVGTIAARGSVDLVAGGALLARNASAGEGIALTANGALVAGDLSAGLVNATVRQGAEYNIGIVSGTSVAVGKLGARDWIGIGTRGALTTGAISSGNDVLLTADGAVRTGGIATGSQNRLLVAGADMVALGGPIDAFDRSRLFAALGTSAEAATRGAVTIGGPVTTGRMDALVGGDFTTGNLSAALLGINVRTGGALATGAIDARNDIRLDAAKAITTAAIGSRDGGIRILGGGDIATGNLAGGGGIRFDSGGTIATGSIAARRAELIAVGNVKVGNATISEWFDAESNGALSVGNITAGEGIDLAAQGTLVAGDLSAGLVNATVRQGAEYNIGIVSGTSVAVGKLGARDWIGIGTRGALATGAISSGNDVLLAADGAITTGGIATGSQNRLLIAGADMVALGGPIDAFDPSRLFAALGTSAEAATRGAVTIGGPVTTGRMDALIGGDFTAGALSATNAAFATVGGTMAINGAWTSALSRIMSNDLAIGASGAIGGGRSDLISRNATQLLVGDGLSGNGYAIDNAEFGRLSAATINVVGRSDASAAIDTLVGTLSLTGRAGGSSVTIATASGGGNEPAGSLRVTGAVSGPGFGANDALTLAAGRVEVDAATGSVSLGGSSGQPGGTLSLVGQRVHVAEGAILDRLAADPNYATRDADLARAPVAQRPDGVVRAGKISIKLASVGTAADSPYSVLVQNVGTSRIPAGFAATTAEIVSPAGIAPGLIDLNVYGQLVTPTATLTGVAVRDALMANDNPARYFASSLINGCALTGRCGSVQPPFVPQPAISTEIALRATPPEDDRLFGNEETIEDNEEEGGDDSASSPIAPPVPLFNTKPLEQKSDTDEPVSGGGNPALIGSSPVEGKK